MEKNNMLPAIVFDWIARKTVTFDLHNLSNLIIENKFIKYTHHPHEIMFLVAKQMIKYLISFNLEYFGFYLIYYNTLSMRDQIFGS